MLEVMRWMAGSFVLLGAAACLGAPVAYEPRGLAWSEEEVERPAMAQFVALVERARRMQQLGCRSQCERLARVFGELIGEARLQTERSARLQWSLTVVQLPDIEAQAMARGHVVISERYVEQQALSQEALAFVLAHEMAHIILEHERQALSFALLLLPRHIVRSVRDMYVEMDFSLSLLKRMEPVMQQGEFEADELGFLMASAAGFDPERQLEYIEKECRADAGRLPLVSTHPPACARLLALRTMLPLAKRQHPSAARRCTAQPA